MTATGEERDIGEKVRYKVRYSKKVWAFMLILSAFYSVSLTLILNLENEVRLVVALAYMILIFVLGVFIIWGLLTLFVKAYAKRREQS
jgi:hypothetical protein